jgi:RNA polymerase sigma-70 factor, ECF subfamily
MVHRAPRIRMMIPFRRPGDAGAGLPTAKPATDASEAAPRPLRLVVAPASRRAREPETRMSPVEREPAELMARVRAGDTGAFENLVERLWRRVFLYAYHLVGDADRASDVAQEAFARLWQKRAAWHASGGVEVWLLRTARNVVISEQRKLAVRKRFAVSVSRQEARRPRTPLQDAEDEELRAAIMQAIHRLSQRRREVFTLFHLQGLSYREISEIMEIRPQTVANYLKAALADLRAALAPHLPGLSGDAETAE